LSSWLFSTKLGKRAVCQKYKTFKFQIDLSGIWKAVIEPRQLPQNRTFHATFRHFCVKSPRPQSSKAGLERETSNGFSAGLAENAEIAKFIPWQNE
jgi:hypothetical protein